MTFLFQNNGKACAAKSVFMIAFFGCMFQIILAGLDLSWWSLGSADYHGMAVFLSPLAALYWGRSKTKSDKGE